MTIGEAVLKLLRDQLVPDLAELKQGMIGLTRVQEALISRLDRMEQESAKRFDLIDRRFELIDKRFEQIDKRFEQIDKRFEQIDKRFDAVETQMRTDKAEHARQMEALDKRMERLEVEHARQMEALDKRMERLEVEHARQMELLDKRMERLESTTIRLGERVQDLSTAVGKLSLLGDYVRRVDELAAELRELRRHQDEFERLVQSDMLKLLPKPATG